VIWSRLPSGADRLYITDCEELYIEDTFAPIREHGFYATKVFQIVN
jgi:hypothetical protein